MNKENLLELWNVYVAISEGEPVSLVQWIAAVGTVAGIIGSAYTLWWATTKAVKAGRMPFGWLSTSELCREACKLLLSSDTQTDAKKLPINGLGETPTETTVKAGGLVVCLETGLIQLFGSPFSSKLSRRECRRILSVARYVRKRILRTELERDRQVAAHLLKVMAQPATTGATGGILYTAMNGAPQPPPAVASLSPATRRFVEESLGGKPTCPGCR